MRKLGQRRQREKLGLFVCEGEDLVRAGLDAGLEPVEALVDRERPALLERLPGAELVESRLMGEISTLGHPARVLAIFRRAELPQPRQEPGPGLALWRVGDTGNVGTLIRAADALGAGFVALSEGCADPTAGRALRASAGAIFRTALLRFEQAGGFRVALSASGGLPLAALQLPAETTFVLGAEREGLPPEAVAACDAVATIPQAAQAESLNVAMAGTVALYELARRKL